MDNFLALTISFFNSRRTLKKVFPWLIQFLIYLRSVILWITKTEFAEFGQNLFYVKKQSRHPLVGERSIEYPWVYKKLQDVQGKNILDVGCKEGLPITDMLIKKNFVFGIDPNINEQIKGKNYLIFPGDIRHTQFSDNSLDIVVAVSTLEHIGISDRYNIKVTDNSGDLNAAKEIYRILKPGGGFVGTVPFGKGKSLPLNRLYDQASLRQVLEGYELVDLVYFRYYENYGLWLEVDGAIAEMTDWDTEPWYSLACFYARKPN